MVAPLVQLLPQHVHISPPGAPPLILPASRPALSVFEHFVSYYLLSPLVRLSRGIAATADAAYGKRAKDRPAGAALALRAPLTLLACICAIAARNDAQDNRM